MTNDNHLILNDIESTYARLSEELLSEMLVVTNHSTLLDVYNVNAASLYELLRPRGLAGGVRRRVIITSPPYGLLRPCGFSPRFGRLTVTSAGNLSVITGKHFRAAWLGVLTSMYLCLNQFHRNRDLAVIVLKNFKNNNVEKAVGKNLVNLTVELAEFVGFKHLETLKFKISGSHFARYHDIKQHVHDLWHEYALVFRKVV
ncbi:MAG: hypothetical protein QW074_03515 [Candidatus Caldarchaeum sp.]